MRNIWFILLTITLLCSACHERVVYTTFHSLPLEGWHQDSALTYTAEMTDSTAQYDTIQNKLKLIGKRKYVLLGDSWTENNKPVFSTLQQQKAMRKEPLQTQLLTMWQEAITLQSKMTK